MHDTNDEIDLRELLHTLWQRKITIVLSTFLVTAIAAAYAFLTPPTYETTSRLIPPTPADLNSYNLVAQSDEKLPTLDSEQAYAVFLRHLNSGALKLKFFDDYYLPANASNSDPSTIEREKLWEQFNKDLTIQLPDNKNVDLATVRLQGTQPAVISQWVNDYVQMALQAGSTQVLNTLKSTIAERTQRLEVQIASLRAAAEQERLHRISRIEEDLALAKAIDLDSPASNSNLIISYTNGTAYLRGSLALASELQLLKNRDNNDPFIKELPMLAEQLAALKNLHLPNTELQLATVDSYAVVPESPIKPKKTLVLLLGLLLGGMLGVLTALLQTWWYTPKQK